MLRALRLKKLYCSTSLILRYGVVTGGAGDCEYESGGVTRGVATGVIVGVRAAIVEYPLGVVGVALGGEGSLSLSIICFPSAATPARNNEVSTMAIARANLGNRSPSFLPASCLSTCRPASAAARSVTRMVVEAPSLMTSLSLSDVPAGVTSRPLTKVPLTDPASAITHDSLLRLMLACKREMLGSLIRTFAASPRPRLAPSSSSATFVSAPGD